jgi:hypothetical protein
MLQVIGEVENTMSQFGATAKNPPWVRTTGKLCKVLSLKNSNMCNAVG